MCFFARFSFKAHFNILIKSFCNALGNAKWQFALRYVYISSLNLTIWTFKSQYPDARNVTRVMTLFELEFELHLFKTNCKYCICIKQQIVTNIILEQNVWYKSLLSCNCNLKIAAGLRTNSEVKMFKKRAARTFLAPFSIRSIGGPN